jgi:anti-sigma factor RsiW
MIETFRCDDKETLVAYLYGDIDADGRREVERHLRTCPACTRETEGLQAVRQDLASWLPPDAELGFAIAQKPSAAVVRPPRWALLGTLPVWAQVAAAALFIAAGAAIANLQIRSTADGLVVTTGWMQPASTVATAPVVTSSNDEWRRELVALEQNLRRDLAPKAALPMAVSTRAADATDTRAADAIDTAAVLRRVEAMLTASEQRQREALALRLSMADRDWNMRRQADLMNINQIFSRLQRGAIRTEAGQREVTDLIRRVSTQPIQ